MSYNLMSGLMQTNQSNDRASTESEVMEAFVYEEMQSQLEQVSTVEYQIETAVQAGGLFIN